MRVRLSNFEKRFLEYCSTSKLICKGESILVALSGGADSVALLRLLLAIKPFLQLNISAAHCNFKLRATASARDENFCKSLCEGRGVQLFTKPFNTKKIASTSKLSIEETARKLRYQWFNELSAEYHFSKLATAHHKNDNAETILFNLFRGSSLLGLSGIPKKRGIIIRPLIDYDKSELLNYLSELQQPFQIDESNFKLDFDRNFIRLKVIPLIEKRFANKLLPNLSRISEHAVELQDFLELHISKLMRKKGLSFKDSSFEVSELKNLSSFEQKEILKRALKLLHIEPSSQILSRLHLLLESQSGKKVEISKHVHAVRKKTQLVFVTSE